MGLQWFTRAASMDDEKKSRFVGKINWIAPPGGGQRIANDGYAISKYSSKDKDAIFRMIATAASQKSMQKGAEFAMPPRLSVLDDPELAKQISLVSGRPRIPRGRQAVSADVRFPRCRRHRHAIHPAGRDQRKGSQGRAGSGRRRKPPNCCSPAATTNKSARLSRSAGGNACRSN